MPYTHRLILTTFAIIFSWLVYIGVAANSARACWDISSASASVYRQHPGAEQRAVLSGEGAQSFITEINLHMAEGNPPAIGDTVIVYKHARYPTRHLIQTFADGCLTYTINGPADKVEEILRGIFGANT